MATSPPYGQLRDEGLLELRSGRGAIVVRGEVAPSARLHGLLRDLIAEAADQGITTGELTRMMESMR